MKPPLRTLLFDLDGTLLDVDMPAFLEAFFSLAARRFVRPPELPRIKRAMIGAAREMMTRRGGRRTLDLVFLESFSLAIKRAPVEVRRIFTAFYRAEFEQLRRFTAPRPVARPALEKALALGYELAIATNPVFFLDAIRARLRWAGLEGIPFALVTSAEIMRCAKPHPDYFAQTLKLLGRRPGECLMIGDDPRMDLPAGLVGIGTWLVTAESGDPPAGADGSGTLAEFAAWLQARGAAAGGRTRGKDPGARRVEIHRKKPAAASGAATEPGAAPMSPAAKRPGAAASPQPLPFRAVEDFAQEIETDFAPEAADSRPRIFTLRSMIRAGGLEPRAALRLWIRIMRALAERHRAGIVFGCLTPDAIVFDGEGKVRIERAALPGIAYIAPEIQAGQPSDHGADVYSMGTILFELVTGGLDFVGQKRPAELQTDIPPWLDKLILRCTEKNRARRYRTTDEIAAALLKLKTAAKL